MNRSIEKLHNLLDDRRAYKKQIDILRHVDTDYMSSANFYSRASCSSGTSVDTCQIPHDLACKLSVVAIDYYQEMLVGVEGKINECIEDLGPLQEDDEGDVDEY